MSPLDFSADIWRVFFVGIIVGAGVVSLTLGPLAVHFRRRFLAATWASAWWRRREMRQRQFRG